MQTLSKAWGLAALRLGMAFASEEIIDVFNKIKYPYNIGQATQELVLQALENIDQVNDWTKKIVAEREKLEKDLSSLSVVKKIYPSDANFLLVRVTEAKKIYHIELYRLKNEEEVIQAGVEDCVYSGAICMVEWPEKAPDLFDEKTVHVFIEPVSGTERRIDVQLPNN